MGAFCALEMVKAERRKSRRKSPPKSPLEGDLRIVCIRNEVFLKIVRIIIWYYINLKHRENLI
jgi:hypothetical protein